MRGKILALALAAAACAARADDNLPDGPEIYVDVKDGKIVVPDTVDSYPYEGGLKWSMANPGYYFPDGCVVVDSKGKHQCGPMGVGKGYCHCTKIQPHESNVTYKYTIKVAPIGSLPTPPALDPYIHNK